MHARELQPEQELKNDVILAFFILSKLTCMYCQAEKNDKNDCDCQLMDVFLLLTTLFLSLDVSIFNYSFFFYHTICFCLMGFIMYDPSDIFSNVASVMFE